MYDSVEPIIMKESDSSVVCFICGIWINNQTCWYLTLIAHWVTLYPWSNLSAILSVKHFQMLCRLTLIVTAVRGK